MAEVGRGEPTVDATARHVIVPVDGGTQSLLAVVRRFDEHSIAVQDIGIRKPTLDDAFLSLTGRDTRTEEASDELEPSTR